jgi:DNA replication protein DnaC
VKQTEIKRLAHELRLFGVHENFERRLTLASSDGQTGEELLIHLLEDEKQYRKNRVSKSLETKAKFRRTSLIEDWDTSIERGISKTKVRELATLDFFYSKKNLIIIGPTGCGKTQLSIALGRVACQNQLSVIFISVDQLFEEMRAQRNSGKYLTWAKNIKKYDVVVFDDFGLRNYTHDEAAFLVDFLEDRYQKNIHIFTSQVDIEGWKSLFEDPVIAQALIDRIKNPSEKIQLTGSSYREKLGKNEAKGN